MGKHKPSQKSVHKGRPPLAKLQKPTLSAKATRTLIRTHHTLLKAHSAALTANDAPAAAAIAARIASHGGLAGYQHASRLGQSHSRGGDSSRVLVEWLAETPAFTQAQAAGQRLRMLEVGALSVNNACARVAGLKIDRIDLHAQDHSIREIDFMELELPRSEDQRYHVVSLSLVLNFVPEAKARGRMLARIPEFLRRGGMTAGDGEVVEGEETGSGPSLLFFVLPLPCVENARYMDEERLGAIMATLGFTREKVKRTAKLYYSLWRYDEQSREAKIFPKKELRAGGQRNNFAIILQ